MNTLRRCIGLGALALALAPAALGAQVATCFDGFGWGIAPMVLNNDADEKKLAGRAHAELCTSGHDLRREDGRMGVVSTKNFPFSWHLESTAYVVGLPSGELAPFETAFAGRAGLSLSLSGPAPVVDCEARGLSDDECEQAMLDTGGEAFDLGFVVLSVFGKFEAGGGWEERSGSGGLELRYANPRSWVPSVLLTYDRVKPVASEARDALALDRSAYGRTMVRGYWAVTASRLRLELDAAAYRAQGLDAQLEAAGWDSGAYVSGSVGIDPRLSLGFVVVESIFVQYADGRLPSSAMSRRTWSAGIELGQVR